MNELDELSATTAGSREHQNFAELLDYRAEHESCLV